MDIDELLSGVAAETGLGALVLDARNACRIVFDGRLPVDIEYLPESGSVFLHAVVRRQAVDDGGALAARMLAANLFGRETGDASLGLDELRGEIVLFRKFRLGECTVASFVTGLSAFTDRLEALQRGAAQTTVVRVEAPPDADDLKTRIARGSAGVIRG